MQLKVTRWHELDSGLNSTDESSEVLIDLTPFSTDTLSTVVKHDTHIGK